MADGVEWFFQLVDKVSAPARAMADSVGKVGDALAKTDSATAKATEAMKKLGDAQGAAGAKSKGFQMDVGSSLASWAEGLPGMLATAAAGIVAAGATLVAAGIAFAAHSQDSKRNALFAMQTFLGAGEDARATMAELEGYAGRSALAKDTFLAFGNRLLGSGFQKQELAPLLGAVSDIVGATGGNAAAGEKLMALLEKARVQNKLDPREMMKLGDIGISQDSIAQAIADQRKITIDEAYGVLNAGQMNGNQISDAILGAVAGKNKGGALGGVGEAFAGGSLTVGIQHLQDAFGDLFENVSNGGLIDFIHELTTSLQGEGGAKMVKLVNDAFSELSGWLATISMDDIKSGITTVVGVLQTCWDVVRGVWAAVTGFGAGFMAMFDSVLPLVKEFWTNITGGADSGIGMMDVLKGVFYAVGVVLAAVVMVVVLFAEAIIWLAKEITLGLMAAFTWLYDGTGALFTYLGALPGRLLAFGTGIVDGLWDGIKAGWATLISNFGSLVDLLPAVVKKALGIASPSTVFAGFGFNVTEGFGQGLDRGDMPGQMESAMALPSSPSVDALGARASGASTMVSHAPSVTIEVHVTGSAHDGEALADELRRVLLPELTHAFEQMAMEVGA